MRIFLSASIMFMALSFMAPGQDAADSPAIWDKAIADFEASDKEKPVAPGGILFVGSSSIRMWALDKWFPGLPVLNRGFGGSQIADSVYYFDRVVAPYKPSTIVFYAGDNDIAKGKAANVVAADFKTFATRVWSILPETRVLFIGIKPSTARWSLYPEMKKANEAIRQFADAEGRLVFVDVEAVMLGDDGMPRTDLLQKDGLHMTEEGYAIWTRLVLPELTAPAAG